MTFKIGKFNIDAGRMLGLMIPVVFGWISAYLCFFVFRDYALGLFIWLPFVMCASTTLLVSKFSSTRLPGFETPGLTLLIFSLGLIVFAWEGVICLVMASPIAIGVGFLGHVIAKGLIKKEFGNKAVPIIVALMASTPVLMGFEDRYATDPKLQSVITSIEIDASPETVWKNVVSFPQLKAPTEFIFQTGIAYPINATIKGSGVGAIRYCNFSTGSFVEPITQWEAPYLLAFSVEEQPIPMKELGLRDLSPQHLDGYWISQKGEFRLTRLPGNRTKLVGTTWYYNKIAPSWYWTLWSDVIVHKIHHRVLDHIKEQAESSR